MRQISIHLSRYVVAYINNDSVDVYVKKPYRAHIHCYMYLEHGTYHYLVTVEVIHTRSIGVDYGWHKEIKTRIMHKFYGYHAEKRFKAIYGFLKIKQMKTKR